MSILYAIIFGTLFGFVLQRVGAADPDKIIGMLQLKDMHLMKVILLAIGFSSALLFMGMSVGIIDAGHLSVKAMYWGVIVGGAILGTGWAISGFCPGTGVVAAGSGRKDAWFFVLGGLLGAGLFTVMYESLSKSWLFSAVAGGKTTLAANAEYSSLLEFNGLLVACVIAAIFIAVAVLVPSRLRA